MLRRSNDSLEALRFVAFALLDAGAQIRAPTCAAFVSHVLFLLNPPDQLLLSEFNSLLFTEKYQLNVYVKETSILINIT